VKYIVIFIAAIEGAYFLKSHFILYYLVLLLGLASGFLWHRFAWRRATATGSFGSRIDEIRNGYHRWKRKRAQKKFEVYMGNINKIQQITLMNTAISVHRMTKTKRMAEIAGAG